MVTAFVLINCRRERIAQAAEQILKLKAVTEVYSVAGPYDIVAVARVAQNEQLANLVTQELLEVEGITSTTTLIAFRQYSRYDLERMFSIGE